MAFRFRFAAILQLRRRERDEAGAAVSQALQAIVKIEGQLAELEGERRRARDHADSRLVGELSVDRLLGQGRYDLQLKAQAESLRHTLTQLHAELGQRQQRLVEAETEVRKFEKLESQDRDAAAGRRQKREQQQSDEFALIRHAYPIGLHQKSP